MDEKYHGSSLLGAAMDANESSSGERPSLLNVVALLADGLGNRLARGQVGTVVETLCADALLVEFSDDEGRPTPLCLARVRTFWSCTMNLRRHKMIESR